jgi:crossover junction endodeoxyribonuclease RusA
MWTLLYPHRPWTTNADRNLHPHQRAKRIKEWRKAFCQLATEQGIPLQRKIAIMVTPILPDRRIQDTAACNPAAKAAIDGLIDAGVIIDDTKEYLEFILFKPCEYRKGEPGLMLEVIPNPEPCTVCEIGWTST